VPFVDEEYLDRLKKLGGRISLMVITAPPERAA
jgi:hypothetical protein